MREFVSGVSAIHLQGPCCISLLNMTVGYTQACLDCLLTLTVMVCGVGTAVVHALLLAVPEQLGLY